MYFFVCRFTQWRLEVSFNLLCVIVRSRFCVVFHCMNIQQFILLMDIWMVWYLGQLWRVCLWSFLYMSYGKRMDTFLWGLYLGEKFSESEGMIFSFSSYRPPNRKSSNHFTSFPALGIIDLFIFSQSRGYTASRNIKSWDFYPILKTS